MVYETLNSLNFNNEQRQNFLEFSKKQRFIWPICQIFHFDCVLIVCQSNNFNVWYIIWKSYHSALKHISLHLNWITLTVTVIENISISGKKIRLSPGEGTVLETQWVVTQGSDTVLRKFQNINLNKFPFQWCINCTDPSGTFAWPKVSKRPVV